jgi:hypothetical protein
VAKDDAHNMMAWDDDSSEKEQKGQKKNNTPGIPTW